MKISLIAAASLLLAGGAGATTPAVSMHFLAAPAIPVQGTARGALAHVRTGDRMVVVVKEAAACGQRLGQPQAALANGVLRVGFSVPQTTDKANCLATGIFTLHGLPREPIMVTAQMQAPATAASDLVAGNRIAAEIQTRTAGPVAGRVQRGVHQVRKDDQLIAEVTEPAACGTQLLNPWVSREASRLDLHYDLTRASGGAPACAATAAFVMKNLPAIALTAQAPIATGASKGEGGAAAATTMGFLAAPAQAQADRKAERSLAQVHNGDTLTVVVHEPAPCGERAQNPSYQLLGQELTVRYQLPQAKTPGAACIATAVLTFHGLPASDIHVVAAVEPAPSVPAAQLALNQ